MLIFLPAAAAAAETLIKRLRARLGWKWIYFYSNYDYEDGLSETAVVGNRVGKQKKEL